MVHAGLLHHQRSLTVRKGLSSPTHFRKVTRLSRTRILSGCACGELHAGCAGADEVGRVVRWHAHGRMAYLVDAGRWSALTVVGSPSAILYSGAIDGVDLIPVRGKCLAKLFSCGSFMRV